MGAAALQSRPAFAAWPAQGVLPAGRPAPLRRGAAKYSGGAPRERSLLGASVSSCLALLAVGASASRERRPDGRGGHLRRSASSRGRGFATVEKPSAGKTFGGPVDSARGQGADPFPAAKYGKLAPVDRSTRAGKRLSAKLPAFRQWLSDRGCEGVDNVVIMENSRPGIRVRDAVTKGAAVLRVPRSAWISIPLGALELEPETELAWRLVREHWMGEGSEFSPYVDFLWGVDLSLHPVFWSDEEVAWLQASPGAHEEVLRVRQTVSERVGDLAARASAADAGAPAELLAEPARLEAELRFALVLVEARAIEAIPAAEGEPPCAAMVPLLDHLQHDAREEPHVSIGEDGDLEGVPMFAVANRVLHAGEEVRHCYEPVGNAQLLAHYGFVPVPEGTSQEQRLRANAFASVALPVRSSPEFAKVDSESCLERKLELLAEHTALDLRQGAGPEVARLELPKDIHAGGRFLPLARLLTMGAKPDMGQTPTAACDALFARLFEGVGPDATSPAPVLPVPATQDDVVAEVVARATAWEWCERLLKRYQKACTNVMEEMGMSPEEGQEETSEDLSESVPSAELENLIDSVVLAHYKAKAKSPDRRSAKSKKPREARLLAISDGRATVQFLSNGVRHQVPQDWVVRKRVRRSPQSQLVDKTRTGRGQLVMALYSNEAAVVETAYYMTQNIVQLGTQLLEAQGKGSASDVFGITANLKEEWDSEQKQVHEFARKAKEAEE